jgi:hypothetical protein
MVVRYVENKTFSSFYISLVNRGNSVSIVSGCGLDDRAIEVRSPAVAKVDFFL